MRFLDWATEGDRERQAVLQEMTGYFLRFDTTYSGFFVLAGEGANGKSTFLAALRALLGDRNVSSVALEMFGERFQLTPTLGKLVNAVSEVGEMGKVAEGVLKAFAVGDLVTFDRKNKEPLSVCPTARVLLACNRLPTFVDRSNGVWRRLNVVPFTATVAEAEKVIGMDKPEYWADEAAGILNWALVGLHRLYTRGHFTPSAACERAKGAHREACNPHRQFIDDFLVAKGDATVRCGEVLAAYAAWCAQRQYHPLAENSFGEEIRRAFPGVKRVRPRDAGARVYTYTGVGWRHGVPTELLPVMWADTGGPRRGPGGPGAARVANRPKPLGSKARS
jgi:P4 family phage/plasmid primase-like protien